MPSLLPFIRWYEHVSLSVAIRNSRWLFPAIEAVHIVALTVLLGALLLLNLRLLGVTLRSKPVSELARELAPWTLCTLVVMLVTGAMLFASQASKYYASPPFQVKMVLLFAAILSQFAIHRRVTKADQSQLSPLWGKLAASLSLVLWLGVGVAGRAIGFY
jgi:hypothetical protein